MSRQKAYEFLRLNTSALPRSASTPASKPVNRQAGPDPRAGNPGVYIAFAMYQREFSRAVRYPRCERGSSVLNIGIATDCVLKRWLAPDKYANLLDYSQTRAWPQKSTSFDEVSVWHVLTNPEAERPLYILFSLAVGAFPVLQREQGWRSFDDGKECNVNIKAAEFRVLSPRDLETAFFAEHWRTQHRIHALWRELTAPDHAGCDVQLRFQRLGDARTAWHGDTDVGTPILNSLQISGVGATKLAQALSSDLHGLGELPGGVRDVPIQSSRARSKGS